MQFNELLNETLTTEDVCLISEAFHFPSLLDIRKNIANPDIRPDAKKDVSVLAWLERLKQWGKISVVHHDPEYKTKKQVSVEALYAALSDKTLLNMFGGWSIDRLDINVAEIHREYTGLSGKRYNEKFILSIELRPEIKQAMRK